MTQTDPTASDVLTLGVDLIDQITAGAEPAQMAAGLARLRALAEAGGDPRAARLSAQVTTLMQRQREARLTEHGLTLLTETTHDLSGTLSLEALLHKIVSRARRLAGANIVWLTMLDEDTGAFHNVVTEGNLLTGTANMTSDRQHGAVSVVMATKSVFTTQDYLNDDRFPHLPALDANFESERIVSLAGFPILSDGRVLGLLFVADRYSRSYSGREISVLGSFATHAGVAIRNAHSFSRLSEALAETERNRLSLEDHVQRVEDSARTHDVMMSLLAQGADLVSFMQRMASLIGGGILYLDAGLNAREDVADPVYQGALWGQVRAGQVDRAQVLQAVARSRQTGRAALVCDTGAERCLALALHGESARRDCLIVCHGGDLDEIHLRNLERSTVALSIAKLWAEKRETEQQIASSTLLRHLVLVRQPDAPTVTAVRDRLALTVAQPVQMVLIVVQGLDRQAQTDLVREAGARLGVLTDLIDDAYLAIGPEREIAALRDTLRRRTARMHEGAQAGGLVSDAFVDLAQAPRLYARLHRALGTLMRIAPPRRFLPQSEVGLFARLFEDSDPARIAGFVRDRLAPIHARDPRGRAQLKATLLAYFDHQYNLARTAQALGVHVNTVRQRLETLRDVTGGWDDPVTALELQMSLRLDALGDTGAQNPT